MRYGESRGQILSDTSCKCTFLNRKNDKASSLLKSSMHRPLFQCHLMFGCEMFCANSREITFALWNATWKASRRSSSLSSPFSLSFDEKDEFEDNDELLLSSSISYMRREQNCCQFLQQSRSKNELHRRIDMAAKSRILWVREIGEQVQVLVPKSSRRGDWIPFHQRSMESKSSFREIP
jgi:hypothetical protein